MKRINNKKRLYFNKKYSLFYFKKYVKKGAI